MEPPALLVTLLKLYKRESKIATNQRKHACTEAHFILCRITFKISPVSAWLDTLEEHVPQVKPSSTDSGIETCVSIACS